MEASQVGNIAAPERCPLCETGSFERTTSGRSAHDLWSCRNCSLEFFYPLAQASAEWYAEGYRYRSLFESKELRWNHHRFLKHPASGRSLLDVGCGTGSLLLAAREHGYTVAGLDFDREAVETARVRLGIDDVHSLSAAQFRQAYPDRRFDVVTAFEVIEHVESPADLMRECSQLLKPGGELVISTPYRDRWPNVHEAWDYPPHHLTRWDKAALAFAINLAGCRLIDMETGWTASANMLSDLTRLGIVKGAISGVRSDDGKRAALRIGTAAIAHQAKKLTLTAIGIPIDVALRGLGATGIDLFAIGRRDPSISD
jgi:2-polyprenyl-3-methyl-5-hydroxy-6-metoxy-1,4-benzoquinol methylase